MSKVKNIISVVVMSAIATLSLTVGASALTQSVDSETTNEGLTKLSNGYWYGNFEQNSNGLYGNTFTECKASTLTIKNQFTATVEAKDGYKKMFRSISILASGYTTTSDYAQGNNASYTVSVSKPNNLKNMIYQVDNYDGTEAISGMYDGYFITVDII